MNTFWAGVSVSVAVLCGIGLCVKLGGWFTLGLIIGAAGMFLLCAGFLSSIRWFG